MDVTRILAELDTEISRLQQIRSALTGMDGSTGTAPKKRGRPKGSKNAVSESAPAETSKKRTMSPEGRARIAAAMKRRWAARKKGVPQ